MNNDKFGSDHYKKQSNSLFGKQIENVENYSDTKLANVQKNDCYRRIKQRIREKK